MTLVAKLPVAVGQREERYTHLLAGELDLSKVMLKTPPSASSTHTNKIAELELRVERLEAASDLVWENKD